MVCMRAMSLLIHLILPVSFLSVPFALSDFNLERSPFSSSSLDFRSSSLNSLKVLSFILAIIIHEASGVLSSAEGEFTFSEEIFLSASFLFSGVTCIVEGEDSKPSIEGPVEGF